jgi:hypothetical protein
MDKKVASYLLASLMERISRNQIGTVSGHEREALAFALNMLSDGALPIALGSTAPSPAPLVGIDDDSHVDESIDTSRPQTATPPEAPRLPEVKLVLDCLDLTEPSDPDVLLCLDFGTAMSKAFAANLPDEYMDLELGLAAGRKGHVLPSSVFIGDDGKAYFGFEALEQSLDLVESGRERLDSIKSWLSLRQDGNLDGEACVLSPVFNPTPYKLTQGDLIRLYLAFLTDMAGESLSVWTVDEKVVGRYVKRRFARPCWPNEAQTKWADRLMRGLLADAQILADTFHNQWKGGIDVARLKAALIQVKALDKRPDYLIDMGIPEPVAVAAGAIADSANLRDAFMVVDVGAGTTDFGLFISTHNRELDVTKVFQVPASIQGLMQAGDKIDGLLRAYISRKEAFDAHDTSGRLIEADLRRKIRELKELLFKTGKIEYALIDGTTGSVELPDFLAGDKVQQFATGVEAGFRKSLEAVDESWLRWLAMDGVNLHVVLTGGSSKLPMMQSLGSGVIEVKGYKIMRKSVSPVPAWMEDQSDEFVGVYPQLAVAIGGIAEEIPETVTAPQVFAGGGGRTSYVAGQLQVSGV